MNPGNELSTTSLVKNARVKRYAEMKNNTNKKSRNGKWSIKAVPFEALEEDDSNVLTLEDNCNQEIDPKNNLKSYRFFSKEQKNVILKYSKDPNYFLDKKIRWSHISIAFKDLNIFKNDPQGIPDRTQIRNCYLRLNSKQQESEEELVSSNLILNQDSSGNCENLQFIIIIY